MLERMTSGSAHDRLTVRTGKTNVKSRNDSLCLGILVYARHIDPRLKGQMIDRKASDLFHLLLLRQGPSFLQSHEALSSPDSIIFSLASQGRRQAARCSSSSLAWRLAQRQG